MSRNSHYYVGWEWKFVTWVAGFTTDPKVAVDQNSKLTPKPEAVLSSMFPTSDTTTTRRPSRPSFGGGDDRSFGSGRDSSFGGSSGRTSFSGSSGSSGGCPYSVDAYTPSDSFSYLFSGSTVYELSGTRVRKTYRVSELFPTAPSRVDAAVFNPTSGMMLLFGNRQVYGYYY
ncbi:hypothetical protein ANCCAN_29048, partial [Ancylostoma caninum]